MLRGDRATVRHGALGHLRSHLVKVRVADTDSLGTRLRERIGAVKSVRSTRTTIVLGTVKQTYRLPVTAPTPERDARR